MDISVEVQGFYWTADNELRECIVARIGSDLIVLDAETLDVVQVRPRDVMVEKPTTPSS